jgi:hypothetical protein
MSFQKVKRFVWMAGHTYYASGGFHDYRGSFDTKEEAEAAQSEWLKDKDYVWSHIGDLKTGEITGQGEGCNPMRIFQK